MRYVQPNNLARALHQVLDDVLRGDAVSLKFDSEAHLRHVLSVLQEVAVGRQLAVRVRVVGPRTLELMLGVTQES